MIPYKHLSLADIFTDCQNEFDNDKYHFLSKTHPDIIVEKRSDSPDEDKSLADSKALIPVLQDFFAKHPLINPKIFLSDSAFDTIQIYHDFFHELKFQTAYNPGYGRKVN